MFAQPRAKGVFSHHSSLQCSSPAPSSTLSPPRVFYITHDATSNKANNGKLWNNPCCPRMGRPTSSTALLGAGSLLESTGTGITLMDMNKNPDKTPLKFFLAKLLLHWDRIHRLTEMTKAQPSAMGLYLIDIFTCEAPPFSSTCHCQFAAGPFAEIQIAPTCGSRQPRAKKITGRHWKIHH